MFGPISRFVDNFVGRGSAAVTVPPLDGALKPNNILEDLPDGIPADAPDDIVLWRGEPVWSDGGRLVSRSGTQVLNAGSPITALAASGEMLAVATISAGLEIFDGSLSRITPAWKIPVRNITALAFAPDGAVWFCTGSERRSPAEWRRDVMELNRAGLVGRADPHSGEVVVVHRKLGYPAGLVVLPSGNVLVSEAWSSHLIELPSAGGGSRIVLDEIPGYPGRISVRQGGGFWLSIFAPRSPLIEFVLREPGYRKAMLRDVAPEFWIAPSYASGMSFSEPLQGGALKQMGILKPWAPTRSYGLVVELDGDFTPRRSFHSRSGGRRHGITAVLDHDGELWLTSRGCGEVLRLQLQAGGTKP